MEDVVGTHDNVIMNTSQDTSDPTQEGKKKEMEDKGDQIQKKKKETSYYQTRRMCERLKKDYGVRIEEK